MKHTTLLVTSTILGLAILVTAGCSAPAQRAELPARAARYRGVITHQDREVGLHNQPGYQ